MGRFQNPKIETKKGVRRPYYYIRPTVPVVTPEGIKRKQREIFLCYCDEKRAKRVAEQKKQEIMAPINAGRAQLVQAQIPFRLILEKFVDAKLDPQAQGGLSDSTKSKYRHHIDKHVLPDLGNLKMADIDTPTLQVWLNQKARDGLSWHTRSDLKNLVSAIYGQARKWKLWGGDNPCQHVEVGDKVEKREKRLLSAQDFRRLLSALSAWPRIVEGVTGTAVRTMVLLAFVTGLRISEILGLKWGDFDWERGTLTVRRRWHRGNEGPPKTTRSKRTRKLGPMLGGLKRLLGEHKPDDWLFAGSSGQPPDDRNLCQHILRPLAKELNIYWEGFGWHTFRRQHITWRQDAGAHPFEAQKMAGHAKPDMTYLYTLTDDKRDEAQLVRMWERLMGEPEGVLQ